MESFTKASPMTGRTTWLSRWVMGHPGFQGETEGPFPAHTQRHHIVVLQWTEGSWATWWCPTLHCDSHAGGGVGSASLEAGWELLGLRKA